MLFKCFDTFHETLTYLLPSLFNHDRFKLVLNDVFNYLILALLVLNRIKPTTFLLWGSSANHHATMSPWKVCVCVCVRACACMCACLFVFPSLFIRKWAEIWKKINKDICCRSYLRSKVILSAVLKAFDLYCSLFSLKASWVADRKKSAHCKMINLELKSGVELKLFFYGIKHFISVKAVSQLKDKGHSFFF